MDKQDLLDVLQLYREMLAENEKLREELRVTREELESLRKMIYFYGGKNV